MRPKTTSWTFAARGVLIVLLAASTTAAAEPWVEDRTDHFVFRYHPAQKKLAGDIIGMAEAERSRIVADLGRGGDVHVEVRLAFGPNDFQEAQPEGASAPVWSTGLAYPQLKLIILQLRGGAGGGPAALYATFRHELSHLMLFQALGGRHAPRWLSEGLAMYHAGEWQFNRAMSITRAIAFRTVIPLRDLDHGFPDQAPEVHLAYAESIEFVSYLFGRFGRAGMAALVTRLVEGDTIDTAARAAFGLPIADVEKDWLKRLRWYYAWIPIISSSATLWFVMTLIFLVGYLRRRAQNRRRLREMEDEELVLSAIGHDYAGPTRITRRKGNGGEVTPSQRHGLAAPVGKSLDTVGGGDDEHVGWSGGDRDKWVH